MNTNVRPTDPEVVALVSCALGRIFTMSMRPFQEGDIEEYERCRAIVLDNAGGYTFVDHRPNYALHHKAIVVGGGS